MLKTLTGKLGQAHLCEEKRKAVRDAPFGLISAIAASGVFDFFVLTCILTSIHDFRAVPNNPLPILKIMTDARGKTGGLALMILVLMCIWRLWSIQLSEAPLAQPSLHMR